MEVIDWRPAGIDVATDLPQLAAAVEA